MQLGESARAPKTRADSRHDAHRLLDNEHLLVGCLCLGLRDRLQAVSRNLDEMSCAIEGTADLAFGARDWSALISSALPPVTCGEPAHLQREVLGHQVGHLLKLDLCESARPLRLSRDSRAIFPQWRSARQGRPSSMLSGP